MIEFSILNCISLCGVKPCILVISFSSVINAFKFDTLVSCVTNVFSTSAFVVSKVDKLVPNEFNVDNTFKPEIYNDPFIFVVLFDVVKPLTFNDNCKTTYI